MCYRFSVLMLLLLLVVLMLHTMVPVTNVSAAPAPDPYAILDIGPPPKRRTVDEHLKDQIEFKTSRFMLSTVCSYPEVQKLPSIASMKDPWPWLAKNLRVKPVDGERLLRLTFRAGKRDEQVAIINAFLRASLFQQDPYGKLLKGTEEAIHVFEEDIIDLERRIKSGQTPEMVPEYREGIQWLLNTRIPEFRAEIARMKQYGVIRWAR
jgi:hypothetical protein